MMRRRSWAFVLASASLVACSSTDSNGPSSPDGGTVVADAGSVVTQTVGATGGTVVASGVSLTIPAGALASDVEVSIAPGAGPIPAGYTGLSAFYTFTPIDTVFVKPATGVLTLPATGANPTVFWSNASGGYDALATSATATSASASITHCGTGFVGAGQAGSDAGGDATAGDDASSANDAGTVADSGGSSDSAASDTGAPSDAGAPAEAGTTEAGTADAGTTDAGFLGIKATIDGVVTTFTANQSVIDQNGIYVITADDSASSTHWTLSLSVNAVPQEVCSTSTADPLVAYTHYTAGVADGIYTTQYTSGNACSFIVQGTATTVGSQAHGVFSATVSLAPDAGVGTHTLASGTYDVIR